MNSKSPTGKNIHVLYKENRSAVMKIIRKHGPISKPEIARMSGLTTVSVTNIIRDLLKVGFIKEKGIEESKGGRRALLFDSNGDDKCSICVDMTGRYIVVAAVDLAGRIVDTIRLPLNPEESTLVLKLIDAIHDFIKTKIPVRMQILGIGVVVPGLVDHETGTVLTSIPLGWHHVPLKTVLSQTFNFPVVVIKDTEAAITGEYYCTRPSEQTNYQNIIYLVIGTGLGIGIMIENKIYCGTNGIAGELGHTIVDPNGPLCDCGSRGCLERLASSQALVGYVQELLGQGRKSILATTGQVRTEELPMMEELPIARIFEAAYEGDPVANEAIRRTAQYLAIGLINLYRTLDPDVIIIGGNIEEKGHQLFEAVAKIISEYPSLQGEQFVLKPSSIGELAVVFGASIAVFDFVFEQCLDQRAKRGSC